MDAEGKKKNCVVFVYEYPYLTSEPFMETEILSLSKAFERVIIFSINIAGDQKKTRCLPPNVESYPLGCGHVKLPNILRGLFVGDPYFRIPKHGLKQIASSLYARGRFNRVYRLSLRILEQIGFDGNDTVFYSYWLNAAMPCLLLKRHFLKIGATNVSAISRGHGYDVYSERNSISFLAFQKEYVHLLDEIDVCSENGANYLRFKYPEEIGKIHVAKLGTSDRGIKTYCFPEKAVLLTCSRFRNIKRIPLFADVFGMVLKTIPNVVWVCIGDGEEQTLVNEAIEKNGIADHVIMLGRLKNDEVLNYYRSSDVTYFINISTEEGLPVSIMEAMSFGIPTIATNVGGTSEIVDNENGRLIDPSLTAKEIADIILSELSLPKAKYISKRKAARHKWETTFSEANYVCWARHLQEELPR